MQKLLHSFVAFSLLLLGLSCSSSTEDSSLLVDSNSPNILLIIADDFGLDACPRYDIGGTKPFMPNVERLMDQGLRYTNFWSNATCTPTRSSIITGKYGFRTSMNKVGDELSTTEQSLQSYIKQQTGSSYKQAVIGKWHLSTDANHPNQMGIDYYAGLLTGGVRDYSNWQLTENGQTTRSQEYITTKITDLAIDWISQQNHPWFLWLAYTAPHPPFHLPPNDLHQQGDLPEDESSINANPLPYYLAMIEAMDTEIGRLLASLSAEELANTTILFMGDNGTPNQVAQDYNNRRVKGTVYQGGINVPLVISGKGISRINSTEDALVQSTDLFATIAGIAQDVPLDIHDAKNFEDLFTEEGNGKEFLYAAQADTENRLTEAVRNSTHKYILFHDGSEALYDLISHPFETMNLLSTQLPLIEDNQVAYDHLKNYLEGLKE